MNSSFLTPRRCILIDGTTYSAACCWAYLRSLPAPPEPVYPASPIQSQSLYDIYAGVDLPIAVCNAACSSGNFSTTGYSILITSRSSNLKSTNPTGNGVYNPDVFSLGETAVLFVSLREPIILQIFISAVTGGGGRTTI